eukprot:SAG31_NODE_6333_length_2062_cov_1.289862_3_plen_45_part_00
MEFDLNLVAVGGSCYAMAGRLGAADTLAAASTRVQLLENERESV